MSRAERLLQLLETLRRHRYPVAGKDLAYKLNISLRTLYRDIASLQGQGAQIEGSPGLGYILKPGFTLPPLMFSEDEIEALVLGSRFVAKRADTPLADAARSAISKIAAVLPDDLRRKSENTILLMGPSKIKEQEPFLNTCRLAIRKHRKLVIHYKDAQEAITNRIIWPFGITFFDYVSLILAFCEERDAFRHFRLDRVVKMQELDERIPRRRHDLMMEWRRHLEPEFSSMLNDRT